jgi:sec-independent protein translocase protein TatA
MMGGLSIWHWLIVAVVVAVVFGGRGKLSSIMGDAAKGIRAFKDGLKDDEHAAPVAPAPHITTVVQPTEAVERDRSDIRG